MSLYTELAAQVEVIVFSDCLHWRPKLRLVLIRSLQVSERDAMVSLLS